MPLPHSFRERIHHSRLTSVSAWRDRILIWGAAVAAGLSVVAFTRLTDTAISLFHSVRGHSIWWPLLVTPIGGMGVVWITRALAPGSAGSGIPQVISALNPDLAPTLHSRFVSLRIAAAKIVLGASALFVGFSTGREGPSVQISASVMHAFGNRFGGKSFVRGNDLMLAGGAAGIAAAFNAPLAGIIFAIEELSRRFEQRSSGLIISAIVLAGMVAISFEGNFTYFGRLQVRNFDFTLLAPGFLCALSSGALGGVFSRLLIQSTAGTAGRIHLFRRSRPIAFAGLCGMALAVLGVVSDGAAHGSGYVYTLEILDGSRQLPVLYVVIKFLATWISYWSGVPGGIFAPCLAIGAGLGNDVALLFHSPTIPLAALGMVGFLAAATQAPITSFIIVMEMIDGHAMVLSLMATALLANLVSKLISPSLYGTLSQLQLVALGVSTERSAISGERVVKK